MTVKIYKLIDPFTSEIRYIGKTRRGLVKRLWEHENGARYGTNKRSYKENWIRQVIKKGGRPRIELVKEVDESVWEQEEIDQIAAHVKNHPLTNITKGGMGGEGLNKRRVAKLDYLTLEVLVTYPSIHEAGEKEDIRYTRIVDACSGRKLVINGFLWRYVGDDGRLLHPERVQASTKRKVGQFDLHKKLVRLYPNLESTNIDPAAISSVCHGKTRTSNGYIWRYLDLYNNVIEPAITYKHKTVAKMDADGNVLEIYENAKQAAEAIEQGNSDLIIRCCTGKGNSHRGFRWKYNAY